MRGMGNLTRAAYANQRMTLIGNFAKVKDEAEYDDRATWSSQMFMWYNMRMRRLSR